MIIKRTVRKTIMKQTTVNFAKQVHEDVSRLIDNIKSVIFMDANKLEYLIAAKIAGGHVMLADSHGVGKTSLARALAGSIKMSSANIIKNGRDSKPLSGVGSSFNKCHSSTSR